MNRSPAGPAPRVLIVLGLFWLCAGAWLRLFQFGSQIVIEDEWHAIHKIVESGFLDIFNSFGQNDYSIPLALYDRFLMERGLLTEWTLKAPMLLCGVFLLTVLPRMLDDIADNAERALWLGMLAISPLLVYFTNTARPYAVTMPAAFVAVIAARRWWLGGSRHWAAAYVASTGLAGWLHPVTLGLTLLPIGYFGSVALRLALTRKGIDPLRRVAGIGLVVLAVLAVLLGPPLYHDWYALGEKAGKHVVSAESLYRTLLLMVGTASPLVLVAALVMMAVGAIVHWRRDRGLTLYLSVLIAVFALVLMASGARWIRHPLVLARYLLPILPFLLLALATGAVAIVRRFGKERSVVLLLLALPAAMLLTGPLPRTLVTPTQFLGHMRFQFDFDDSKNPYVTLAMPVRYPDFYRRLAEKKPESLTLIEMPWSHQSQFNPLPFYQALHRQKVKIGLETGTCGERDTGDAGPGEYPVSAHGIRFANFVHLAALLRGDKVDADFLVVHKTLWAIPAGTMHPWPDMRECIALISGKVGAPSFEDADIVVFALSAVARNEAWND